MPLFRKVKDGPYYYRPFRNDRRLSKMKDILSDNNVKVVRSCNLKKYPPFMVAIETNLGFPLEKLKKAMKHTRHDVYKVIKPHVDRKNLFYNALISSQSLVLGLDEMIRNFYDDLNREICEKNNNDEDARKSNIIVTLNSMITPQLYLQGLEDKIHPTSYEYLEDKIAQSISNWGKTYSLKPDLIIYIDSDPNKCYQYASVDKYPSGGLHKKRCYPPKELIEILHKTYSKKLENKTTLQDIPVIKLDVNNYESILSLMNAIENVICQEYSEKYCRKDDVSFALKYASKDKNFYKSKKSTPYQKKLVKEGIFNNNIIRLFL